MSFRSITRRSPTRCFRDDRIDLAGHDRRARLQRGQHDLAQAGLRPAVHPPQVIGDFHQASGVRLELAGEFDRGVLRRLRREVIGGFYERLPRRGRQLSRDFRGVVRVSIQPGADRRAAEGQFREPRECRLDARLSVRDLVRPAGNRLAEANRGSIHQVRAAGFDHVMHLRRARRSRVAWRWASAGNRSSTTNR